MIDDDLTVSANFRSDLGNTPCFGQKSTQNRGVRFAIGGHKADSVTGVNAYKRDRLQGFSGCQKFCEIRG